MIGLFLFFLMIRRPPISTRTDTLFPYTTLFRSSTDERRVVYCGSVADWGDPARSWLRVSSVRLWSLDSGMKITVTRLTTATPERYRMTGREIGRAHV